MPLAVVFLGHAYGRAGKRAEAQEALQEVEALCREREVPSSILFFLHAGLGDREKTIEYLNQAYEEQTPLLTWVKIAPELDVVRSEPRFQDVLRRMGLA